MIKSKQVLFENVFEDQNIESKNYAFTHELTL